MDYAILNPCNLDNCGGIPYMAPYYNRTLFQDEELWTVRCQLCGNVVSIEWTEDEAVKKWNEENVGYELKKNESYNDKRQESL